MLTKTLYSLSNSSNLTRIKIHRRSSTTSIMVLQIRLSFLKGPSRFLPTGIYAGSPLEMVLRFQFEYHDRITEFLVPSTALLSLTRLIMADIGSIQSSSCYQCSVCSHTKTDLSHATINAFCFGNDWYVCIAFFT